MYFFIIRKHFCFYHNSYILDAFLSYFYFGISLVLFSTDFIAIRIFDIIATISKVRRFRKYHCCDPNQNGQLRILILHNLFAEICFHLNICAVKLERGVCMLFSYLFTPATSKIKKRRCVRLLLFICKHIAYYKYSKYPLRSIVLFFCSVYCC